MYNYNRIHRRQTTTTQQVQQNYYICSTADHSVSSAYTEILPWNRWIMSACSNALTLHRVSKKDPGHYRL